MTRARDLLERDDRQYKLFYGMSSATAMTKHAGGVATYRASEGKTVEVPYRGPIAETVKDILGGVRSACTYVGASALKELVKRTTFILVEEQENRKLVVTGRKRPSLKERAFSESVVLGTTGSVLGNGSDLCRSQGSEETHSADIIVYSRLGGAG